MLEALFSSIFLKKFSLPSGDEFKLLLSFFLELVIRRGSLAGFRRTKFFLISSIKLLLYLAIKIQSFSVELVMWIKETDQQGHHLNIISFSQGF